MWAVAMEFGWRRLPDGGGVPAGPAAVLLGAAIACGAVAALAQLDAIVGSEEPETTALVARMAVPPSAARRSLIDQLIAGLKGDGVWAKLDWLTLTAAHDAQAARLNWRAAKVMSAVNTPVFTVDRGYAGDGATSYLDCGEPPQAGGQFTQNSATIGIWCNAPGTVDGRVLAGASSRTFLTGRSGGSPAHRVNSTVNSSAGSNSWTGHRAAVRTSASAVTVYRDGAVDGTAATPSATPETANLTLLSWTGSAHTDARVSAAYAGAAMSTAEIAAIHGRLATYLAAIGGA